MYGKVRLEKATFYIGRAFKRFILFGDQPLRRNLDKIYYFAHQLLEGDLDLQR